MSHYSPQIIKTLSEQVQNLTPLRDSFLKLERYYHQLTHDFNDLLHSSNKSEKELLQNLKYLEEVHRCLERQFGGYGEELKQMECQDARLQMEKNQLNAQAEALRRRQILQTEQNSVLEGKRKDIAEQNESLTFNIAKYKEMIHNLELAIKSKQYQNLDFERQIKKMELVNEKIGKLNKEVENGIENIQKEQQATVQEICQLQSKLNTYEQLITAKEKQNKESLQLLIVKNQEAEQLKHRKDYIDRLIDTELMQQRELTKTCGELQSLLSVKRDKLMMVEQENRGYQKAIGDAKGQIANNRQELLKLKRYLQTLLQTNEKLYTELEKSCSQDKEVQIMLGDKLEKLLVMNDKITENEIVNRCELPQRRLFKQTNVQQIRSPSPLSKVGSPTAQDTLIRNYSLRTQQMSSTWGSFSKENLHH